MFSRLTFFGIAFFFSLSSLGQSSLKLTGEKIHSENDRIIIEGNVKAEYENMKLETQKLIYLKEEKKIVASGKVRFLRGAIQFTCDRLVYFTEEKRGKGEGNLKGKYDKWYFTAKKIEFDEKKIKLFHVKYTTCNLSPPHYHFQAKEAIFYLKEKVVAKGNSFFLGRIPLFYFPYFEYPLKDLPYGWVHKLGSSNKKGLFLLSHYNWYCNPELRGRIYLDLLEKKGIGEGMDAEWKKENSRFYIYGFQFQEKEKYYEKYESREGAREGKDRLKRWKINFRGIKFNNESIVAFKFEKMSDPFYNLDFYSEETKKGWSEYPLKRKPETYLFLEKNSPLYTAGIKGKWKVNYFQKILEEKPTIYYSLPLYPLNWGEYSLQSNISYLSKEPDGEKSLRILSTQSLTHPINIGNWEINPRIYFSLDFYDEDFKERGYCGYRLRFSKRFFNINPSRTSLFLPYFTLVGRTPSFSSQNSLPYFEEKDRIKGMRGLNTGFWGNWEWGERCFTWNFSGKGIEKGEKEEKTIFQEWSWKITDFLSFEGFHLFDLNENRRNYDSFSLVLKRKTFRVKCGYNFSYPEEENISLSSKWKISDIWNLKFYERYNIEHSFSEESRITVEKKLHCWRMFVMLKSEKRVGESRDWEILVGFRIIGI